MSTRPGLYVTEDTAGAGVRATMGFRGLGAAVVWATTTTGFFVAAGVGTNFRVLGDKGSVTSQVSLKSLLQVVSFIGLSSAFFGHSWICRTLSFRKILEFSQNLLSFYGKSWHLMGKCLGKHLF